MCRSVFFLPVLARARLPVGGFARFSPCWNPLMSGGDGASNLVCLTCPYRARSQRNTDRNASERKQGRGRLARVNGGLRCLPMTEIEREGAWSVRLGAPSLVLVEIATRRRRTTRTPRARLRRRSEKGCVFDQTLVLGIDHRNYASSPFVRLRKRPTSVRIWEIGWLGAGVLLLM